MDIIDQKKDLRKLKLQQRNQLENSFKERYDTWIGNELEQLIKESGFKTIHAYLPMGKEINIAPLIATLLKNDLQVITPKTLPKRKLQNLILHSLNDVESGVFGTKHPSNSSEYSGSFDLIIVPGLAYDKNNYRLGYGGGYYDNFLIHHPNALKVGVFYPFQLVEKVPIEKHDLQLDRILVNFDFS